MRPMGTRRDTAASSSGVICLIAISVRVKPGQIAFTRMPTDAQSIASARVRAATAPLDAV